MSIISNPFQEGFKNRNQLGTYTPPNMGISNVARTTNNPISAGGIKSAGDNYMKSSGYGAAGNWAKNQLKGPSASTSDLDNISSMSEDQLKHTKDYWNPQLDSADRDYEGNMRTAGESYLKKIGQYSGDYKNKIQDLGDQAASQAADGRKVYNTTILPAAMTMLDADMREAGNAMTLEEAGDPNNRIHQAVRAMYNQQGENVQRQGLAASGVLGALGAQNAASAFGQNGPMSVGQQQALYAASQGQASQAFANAQKEMNRLREQGIDRGFTESDAQYQRGERAKGRAKDALGQLSDEQDRYLGQQQGLRGEQGRVAADILGIDTGMAREGRDFDESMAGYGRDTQYRRVNRGLGAENQNLGVQIGVSQGKSAAKNAARLGNSQMMGGLAQAGGTVLGGYLGGPAGAAAGRTAGGAVAGGDGAQPQPAATIPPMPAGGGGGGSSGGPAMPTPYQAYNNPYNGYNPYGGSRAYG